MNKKTQKLTPFVAKKNGFFDAFIDISDGVIVTNAKQKILFINQSAKILFDEFDSDTFNYTIDNGSTKEIKVGKSKDKRTLEMRCLQSVVNNKKVQVFLVRDVTSRVKTEKSLRLSEQRYSHAVNGSNEGLWDWNLIKNKIYFSEQCKSLIGYSGKEIGESIDEWFARVNEQDLDEVKKNFENHIGGKTSLFKSEHRLKHKDGTWRWVIVRGSVIRNKSGKATRIAGLLTDITEIKNTEIKLNKRLDELQFALASEKILMEELDRKNKELTELSITDGLTNLYNHRFLQERFNFEFKRVQRYGGVLSCLIMDIDKFKSVNDTFGHQFGDYVIRQIASIIKTRSREVDICGRYGGEEYMVLSTLSGVNALKYAAKLHSAIENYNFTFKDQSIRITVSIGIAEYQKDIKTKQEMIERADIAMYQAKNDGRNLIRLWKKDNNHDKDSIAVNDINELRNKFHDLSCEMRHTCMESINALIKAIDSKDPLASEHSRNVSAYSVEIAKKMNLPESEIEIIRCAALLHDIGKISIRDQILLKKEPLTAKEIEILKRHPEIGVNILKELKFLEKEVPIVLYHHERFDGKGYPHKLKGKEIPLGASIVGIADAFDAMICGRTYKKPMSIENTCKEIQKGSSTQFAPDIVDILLELIKSGMVQRCLERKGIENE